MSWFYWPEFIILSLGLLIFLFGLYSIFRRFSRLKKRVSQLETKKEHE
ncbi:MAG: hypothetical protein JSY10_01550 [Paenibacillus sp.]|nr:hypothetical protein [Paenibacillus sp.]